MQSLRSPAARGHGVEGFIRHLKYFGDGRNGDQGGAQDRRGRRMAERRRAIMGGVAVEPAQPS